MRNHLMKGFITAILLMPLALQAQSVEWMPDFPVGSEIPLLEAQDQHGQVRSLADLRGRKGLVLLFNRSFDWCPYCKGQLVGLTEVTRQFTSLGYKVATMTYDPVETLSDIAFEMKIAFPLLHDADVTHVNAYGILNEDYEPGSFAYGVPQPGIIVINPDGTITHKFSEEDYRERPDFSVVLEAVRQ